MLASKKVSIVEYTSSLCKTVSKQKKTSASFEKEKTDLKNQSSHYQKMYKHANDFVIVEKTNWRGEKCRVEVRKTDVKPKEE